MLHMFADNKHAKTQRLECTTTFGIRGVIFWLEPRASVSLKMPLASLTSLWSSALQSSQRASEHGSLAERDMLLLLGRLEEAHGLRLSAKRSLAKDLGTCLVNPHLESSRGHAHIRYSFEHLVHLVWLPLVDFVGRTLEGTSPPWAENGDKALKALELELSGTLPNVTENLDKDAWVKYFQSLILRMVNVEVPEQRLESMVGGLVPWPFPTSRLSAFVFLRTPLVEALVGPTMAKHVNLAALAEASDSLPPTSAQDEILKGVQGDLVEALGRLRKYEEQHAAASSASGSLPNKRSRTSSNIERLRADKTAQLRFALTNRATLSRLPKTLVDADRLLSELRNRENLDNYNDLDEVLVSRFALARHLLLLDAALDAYIAEDLYIKRGHGNFGGVAIATDESPPDEPRFAGLRFQITMLYLPFFEDLERWEDFDEPPVRTRAFLADICHCPGKRGEDVIHVIDKQLGRLGLNRADIVGGTGDGGGENEGKAGVHKALEDANPSYVRRRCLPHAAWRCADAAIDAAGTDLVTKYKALASYFTEGITWRRLRTIATSSIQAGGLGLMQDMSEECRALFGKSPSGIIHQRPDSDFNFLSLLRGKEHQLHRLAVEDLRQRDMADSTKNAVESLGRMDERVQRTILCEVLKRCLFLQFHTYRHERLIMRTSWTELSERASQLIGDLKPTEEVLERLCGGECPWQGRRNWVEVAVLECVGDEQLLNAHLPAAMKFHRYISDRASSHLRLVLGNIAQTPWLASSLLSSDASVAQAAAQALLRHLASSPDRSPFETVLFDDPALYQSLVDFAYARPAVLLWHGRGHFQDLFRFLAARFLAGPDHVLDCERIHARWQWITQFKRGLKLHSLNALLKMYCYLEQHNEEFPPHEHLAEHLEVANRAMRDMRAEAEWVAEGWRVEAGFRERLNLNPENHALVYPAPRAEPQPSSYEHTWGTYCRTVLVRGHWYHWAEYPRVYFYVVENKVLAGRAKRAPQAALGRDLVITFFEPVGQNLVKRVDPDSAGKLLSVAELVDNIVAPFAQDPNRTDRELEILLEDRFSTLDLRRFQGILETEAEDIQTYTLYSEESAEDIFFDNSRLQDLTKIAIARRLERATGESRKDLWKLSLVRLRARAAEANLIAQADLEGLEGGGHEEPPAPRARGRGRGRGARGRNGGRGRARG